MYSHIWQNKHSLNTRCQNKRHTFFLKQGWRVNGPVAHCILKKSHYFLHLYQILTYLHGVKNTQGPQINVSEAYCKVSYQCFYSKSFYKIIECLNVEMKANKIHAEGLVSSFSTLLRTRLSRYGKSRRKHGLNAIFSPPR